MAALRTSVCAALLALVCAAPAGAAVRSGVYKGSTDDGARVSFRVSDGGTRISRFEFRRLRMRCSDGDRFRSGRLSSGRRRARISSGGRFAITVRYSDGGRWTARGRIRAGAASGALRLRARFNQNDDAVPNGPIRCDSGRRKFSVRVRRASRREPTFTG